MTGSGNQVRNIAARRGPGNHTFIFETEETESQDRAPAYPLPRGQSLLLTSLVLSPSPVTQDSAFQLLSKPLLPAPVFLEVLGNGSWNPFLDYRALSWGQVFVPVGFKSCFFLSSAGSTMLSSPLTHP